MAKDVTGPMSGPDSSRSERRPVRPQPSPTQRGLALLTRREHSRFELAAKLVARGIDADEAEAAVAKLGEAGWQDEGRFADFIVRSRAATGHGPVRIRAELGTHRLDGELVAAALERFEGDWVAIARDLVQRRYGDGIHDNLALRRKAADLLFRRGFNGDQVRAAIRFVPDD